VIIIAKHINNWIKDSTKRKLSRKLAKCSYPILGCLSKNVQEKIQEKWKSYCAEDATFYSIITNYAFYFITSSSVTYNLYNNQNTYDNVDLTIVTIGTGILSTSLVGGIETIVRSNIFSDKINFVSGSLLGKLVSLPYDYKCAIKELEKN